MDPLLQQVAQCLMDQPLPLDPGLPGESGGFDGQAKMALAGGIIAAVAAMLLAVVDKFDALW